MDSASSPTSSHDEALASHAAELRAHEASFKRVVLAHIALLGTQEWERLRALSIGGTCELRRDQSQRHATAEQLLDVALTTAVMSVDETLMSDCDNYRVGEIEGEPVYYVVGRGIYVWGRSRTSYFTLTFWVTYPAYPPGW
jgi:hypothetical protein